MNTVTSKDGTQIAYDRQGKGPALILINGALARRSDAMSAAASLSPHFTVFAYDRRGRGDSGDTAPYAVEREVEDINALISEAGGTSFVFGHSSGAVLALEAARSLTTQIPKLALYEPPFIIDDSRPSVPEDYLFHLTELVRLGQRSEAVEYFLNRAVGIPLNVIAQMKNTPTWTAYETIAHTLIYDGTIMGDMMCGNPDSIKRWVSVTIPALVMDGGNSPEFMHHGAQELAKLLPHAQHHRFPGQEHGVANEVLAPALVEFFKS